MAELHTSPRTPFSRTLLFLYGTPNLVGTALGLLGLGLFFTGVIGNFWFFIVVGLYALGYLLTPKNRPVDLRFRGELELAELKAELETLLVRVQNRVPKEVLETLQSIQTSVLEALPGLSRGGAAGGHHAYVVRETAQTYLPETLQAYLELPPAFARLHAVKDGKTAQTLLLEQLGLLDATLKEIVSDLHRNDTDRLLVNGRFLEETFRKSELTL